MNETLLDTLVKQGSVKRIKNGEREIELRNPDDIAKMRRLNRKPRKKLKTIQITASRNL